MVGVPRSQGCHLCIKRRVKCDQGQPGCQNCRKYKANCPGYSKELKFISGKHHIRSRRNKAAESQVFLTAHNRSASDHRLASPNNKHSDEHDQSVVVTLVRTPTPSPGQYIGNLVATVRSKISEPVICLLEWVDLERLGRSPVLDSAIYSVGLYLVGKQASEPDVIERSRIVYGKSLAILQRSLKHPTAWKVSETLAAAMMLCLFELFATSISTGMWLKHARGIGTLIEQRGPAAHSQGWGALMILSFRGLLIMSEALYPSGKTCFLSKPEWKVVMRDAGRHILHGPQVSHTMIHIVDCYFDYLVELLDVFRTTRHIRDTTDTGCKSRTKSVDERSLHQQAINLYSHFSEWHTELTDFGLRPEEVPSQTPDSPFPTLLRYRSPGLGAMFMGYWASLLIIQEALAYCQDSTCQIDPKEQLVRNILQSVEYVGEDEVGLYRISFAIHVAFEFADCEMQRWIRTMIPRIDVHAIDIP